MAPQEAGKGSVASTNEGRPGRIVLKETTFDGITYVCPTPDQMDEYASILGREIREAGHSFDRIIPLARGGLTWSIYLMDEVKISHTSPMRIKRYDDDKNIKAAGKPQIVQPLTDPIVGEKVLILDEVADHGDTLELAIKYLRMMGAEEILIATLCYKPHSSVKPDFYAFETSAWVIFPHEIRETVEKLAGMWIEPIKDKHGIEDREPLSYEQMIERFDEIGMPQERTREYLTLWWQENVDSELKPPAVS